MGIMLSASENTGSTSHANSNNKRPREEDKITLSNNNNNPNKSLKDDTVDSLNAEIQALQKQLAQSEEVRQSDLNSYRTQLAKNTAQINYLKQHAESKVEENPNTSRLIQELRQTVDGFEAKHLNIVKDYEKRIADLMQQNSEFYWTLRNYLYAHSIPQPQLNLPPLTRSNIPASMYPPVQMMPIPNSAPIEPERKPQFNNTFLPHNYYFFPPPQNNPYATSHVNRLPQSQHELGQPTNQKRLSGYPTLLQQQVTIPKDPTVIHSNIPQ